MPLYPAEGNCSFPRTAQGTSDADSCTLAEPAAPQAVLAALARYRVSHLPPTASHFWQQNFPGSYGNHSRAAPVPQSVRRARWGWRLLLRQLRRPRSPLSPFGSRCLCFKASGLARGQASFPQTDELSCLQPAEPGVHLACLTDQNSFPSL